MSEFPSGHGWEDPLQRLHAELGEFACREQIRDDRISKHECSIVNLETRVARLCETIWGKGPQDGSRSEEVSPPASDAPLADEQVSVSKGGGTPCLFVSAETYDDIAKEHGIQHMLIGLQVELTKVSAQLEELRDFSFKFLNQSVSATEPCSTERSDAVRETNPRESVQLPPRCTPRHTFDLGQFEREDFNSSLTSPHPNRSSDEAVRDKLPSKGPFKECEVGANLQKHSIAFKTACLRETTRLDGFESRRSSCVSSHGSSACTLRSSQLFSALRPISQNQPWWTEHPPNTDNSPQCEQPSQGIHCSSEQQGQEWRHDPGPEHSSQDHKDNGGAPEESSHLKRLR